MKHQREIRLCFLRVTAEKCRHVQVIRRNFAGDLANVFLDLMDNVYVLRLLRRRFRHFGDFTAGFPGLRQE